MMDLDKLRELLKKTNIPDNMVDRGIIGLSTFTKPMENLLHQMKPPQYGWTDSQITWFLQMLSSMDSNNDLEAYRIGEREARISTTILNDLAGGFAHGIGRSGDIKAPQPKATGGSIINFLTDRLVLFFLKERGLVNVKDAITLPLSTGMTLALTIRGLYTREKSRLNSSDVQKIEKLKNRTEMIIPRMDHKSPLKAVDLAAMEPKIIQTELGSEIAEKLQGKKETKPDGSLSKKDVQTLEFIKKHGLEAVYAPLDDIAEAINHRTFGILSTTSFFPPRAPDYIKEVAKIAESHKINHIINNAYGVQSDDLMAEIRKGIDAGRVDAIVQSTDKNFLTPVGGAIVCSPDPEVLKNIGQGYAGRGTAAPVLQLFVSMLSMGLQGYDELVEQQQQNRKILESELTKLAEKLNERVLDINNPVACVMTLDTLQTQQQERLGGFLYNLRVTGPRVVIPRKKKFGASMDGYPHAYVVMNAAIGCKKSDIVGAVRQLGRAFEQILH